MQHKYDELSPGASYKSKMNQPKQSEIVDLSSDDDESDDEVHHFEVSLSKINFIAMVLCERNIHFNSNLSCYISIG